MNAFLLIFPFFLIRFGLLGVIDQRALSRAAFFAPLKGGEKIAYLFYQLSNAVLILYPLFLRIEDKPPTGLIGLAAYMTGIGILVVSAVQFAKPDEKGLNTGGIYKLSRNPMYVGYFMYFLGCALLINAMPLFFSLFIFQISAHWIILSEERWCTHKFGKEYVDYMHQVRRYL